MTNNFNRYTAVNYFGFIYFSILLSPFVLGFGQIILPRFRFLFLVASVVVSYAVFVFVVRRCLENWEKIKDIAVNFDSRKNNFLSTNVS